MTPGTRIKWHRPAKNHNANSASCRWVTDYGVVDEVLYNRIRIEIVQDGKRVLKLANPKYVEVVG